MEKLQIQIIYSPIKIWIFTLEDAVEFWTEQVYVPLWTFSAWIIDILLFLQMCVILNVDNCNQEITNGNEKSRNCGRKGRNRKIKNLINDCDRRENGLFSFLLTNKPQA